MAKLHEVLAVDGDLEKTAAKMCAESVNTFTKKPEHFVGYHKVLVMFDEERANEEEEDSRDIVTTVAKRLDYNAKSMSKYLNNFATKEATNQVAKADLVVDGTVLIADVPATVLLGLENKLKVWRQVYEAIPTYDPRHVWEEDAEAGKNIYKAKDPIIRNRTEKTHHSRIVAEATEHHPAQVDIWTQDSPIGKWTENRWTSMVSPKEKSDYLDRLDKLIRAAKKARQRANNTEAQKLNIGDTVFKFIHG